MSIGITKRHLVISFKIISVLNTLIVPPPPSSFLLFPNQRDQYVLLGGEPYDNSVHMINLDDSNPDWEDLEPMPDSKKGAFCGVVTDEESGKQSIVVAAGLAGGNQRDTFIYDVDDDSWATDGPAYPEPNTANGISVPFGNTFLTTDGEINDGKVYMYNVELNRWDDIAETSTEHW